MATTNSGFRVLRRLRLLGVALPLAALISPPAEAQLFRKLMQPKAAEAEVFDPAINHDHDAEHHIRVNKPDAVRPVTRVIIPFFQVQFATRTRADASTRDSMSSSSLIMRLDGPTTEQMQTMVDQLYQRFVARLRAKGVAVIDPQEAAAFPAWAELLRGMRPTGASINGEGKTTSTFISPKGLGWYPLPSQDMVDSGIGGFSAMGNIGNVKHEQELLAQSGAAVLGFRAVVDFAQVNGRNFGNSSASTRGTAAIAIKPMWTQMFLLTPDAKGTIMDPTSRLRLQLQTPLLIKSDAIQAVESSTTTGQKVNSVLGTGISLLGGGFGRSERQYDVKADAALWERDVSAALDDLAGMMMARLQTP